MTSLNLQKTDSASPTGLTVSYNEPAWKILVGKGRCNWARFRTISGKSKGTIAFTIMILLFVGAWVANLKLSEWASEGFVAFISQAPEDLNLQAYQAIQNVTTTPVARYQDAKSLFPANIAGPAINAHIESLRATGSLSPDVASEKVELSQLQSNYWTSAETNGYDRILYVPAGERGYLIGAVVNNNGQPVFVYGALVKDQNWSFFNLRTGRSNQMMVSGYGVVDPIEVPFFASSVIYNNSSN